MGDANVIFEGRYDIIGIDSALEMPAHCVNLQ